MTATALQSEIRAMIDRIAEARALADQGREIDAAAIDEAVGALCERAAQAPREDAADLRIALEDLRSEVEVVSKVLDARLTAMREALSDAQRRRQAVSAYGASGSGNDNAGEGR